MVNILAGLALLAVVGSAAGYVLHAKKKGRRCIGCPHAAGCPHAKCGGCGLNNQEM